MSHSEKILSFKEILKAYLKYPTFRLIFWLRICQVYRGGVQLYSRLRLNHYKRKLGIDVNVSTPTGAGLSIVHGGAVYLNAEKIGCNCTFYQSVILGTRAKNESGRPIVEDNVTVYTGAVIVGSITLHEGCVVGANSVVTHDVPAYTLVAGAPAKIVKMIQV